MSDITVQLTVLFEEPFWVGIYEGDDVNQYEVSKVTFGAEPKACEVYEFILKEWDRLKTHPLEKTEGVKAKRINPKRMQRNVKKQVLGDGIGTKAQQALKLQHEQGKIERKVRSKAEKEADKERQFELRQQKRKEKHKGH